jgi:hypothetical protein
MLRLRSLFLSLIVVLLLPAVSPAQVVDSTRIPRPSVLANDSIVKPKHDPRKATIRSAILPGWGQAYNKKYWKIPIVYAAIGIPTYTFFYNKKWYGRTRDAARMLSADPIDTANYRSRVNEKLWVFFTTPNSLNSLLTFRNAYRRDMDYSVLIVLLMWGLNVVDATVDAHLKEFDVSDNLSFHVKPTLMQGTNVAGVSVVFTLGKNPAKTIPSYK